MTAPTVLACGMGINTVGLLAEMIRRGDRLDAILFGDTGGEHDWVYEAIPKLSAWIVDQGYPAIVVVRHTRADGSIETLEEECLRTKRLPSLAYGSSRLCSGKYKLEPQDKWLNHWQPALDAWSNKERVVKLIGYDVDERYRIDTADEWNDARYLDKWSKGATYIDIARAFATDPNDEKEVRSLVRKVTATCKYEKRYPLVEWGWGRAECVDSVKRTGLDIKFGKTACFYCPASKEHEIRALPPPLQVRALRIERGALDSDALSSVRGLGRSFAWDEVINPRQMAFEFRAQPPSMPCTCFDGTDEEDDAA